MLLITHLPCLPIVALIHGPCILTIVSLYVSVCHLYQSFGGASYAVFTSHCFSVPQIGPPCVMFTSCRLPVIVYQLSFRRCCLPIAVSMCHRSVPVDGIPIARLGKTVMLLSEASQCTQSTTDSAVCDVSMYRGQPARCCCCCCIGEATKIVLDCVCLILNMFILSACFLSLFVSLSLSLCVCVCLSVCLCACVRVCARLCA